MKTLFVLLLSTSFIHSQNPEWLVYDTSNHCLPVNRVSSIAIDKMGNKWIFGSSGGGVVKYDGITWTPHNTSSGMPSNNILSIAIDNNDTVWIGTNGSGWAYYDGTNWRTFNSTGVVNSMAMDRNNTPYCGTDIGLQKGRRLSGNAWEWILLRRSGSFGNIAKLAVNPIAIDDSGGVWCGTVGYGDWSGFKASKILTTPITGQFLPQILVWQVML